MVTVQPAATARSNQASQSSTARWMTTGVPPRLSGLLLQTEHVVAPPRAGSPPGETYPHVPVPLHGLKHVGDGFLADLPSRSGELPEKCALLVLATPHGEGAESIAANGRAHDFLVRAR